MSMKITNPDVARVVKSLRFHTDMSLTHFKSYIESDDGDLSNLAEALQHVRSMHTLLKVLIIPSDQAPDISQLRLNMNNVAWDMEQAE